MRGNGLRYEPVLQPPKLWQLLCFSACPSCSLPLDLQNLCSHLPTRYEFRGLSLSSKALTVPTSRHTLLFSLPPAFQISSSSHGRLEQALNLGPGDQDAGPGSVTYQLVTGKAHITWSLSFLRTMGVKQDNITQQCPGFPCKVCVLHDIRKCCFGKAGT